MAAIERVARRTGMDGLSIDAVAREAGISKSSVLYDCGNKSALLAEFIRYRLETYSRNCDEARTRYQGQSNPSFRAMIENHRTAPTDEEMSVAMLICAGAGKDANCREIMREKITEDTQRVIDESADKNRILQAFLALHGLAFLEYFGFCHFDEGIRNQLLDDLMSIAENDHGDRPAGA
ncbi:TetR/AcrR family transcriptional regulator [Pontibaca methylaminivorans]|nr:TetR/AcrR family transcriptional regulator [Pontibaca methylaminivorans]